MYILGFSRLCEFNIRKIEILESAALCACLDKSYLLVRFGINLEYAVAVGIFDCFNEASAFARLKADEKACYILGFLRVGPLKGEEVSITCKRAAG